MDFTKAQHNLLPDLDSSYLSIDQMACTAINSVAATLFIIAWNWILHKCTQTRNSVNKIITPWKV